MTSGKLSPQALAKSVFAYGGKEDSRLIVGPGAGEDSAVIRWEAPYMVVCSDPITGASEGAGALLVDVNVNDLACKGAEPRYLVVTLILPPHFGEEGVKALMNEISQRASQLGVTIAGGHTEFNAAYPQPVLSATAFGEASKPMALSDAQAGDQLILTKHLGLEGMSILATDRPDLLDFLSEEELDELKSWRRHLSVLPESRILRHFAHAMHDPTEGGFDGGVTELALGAGLAAHIEAEKLPLHPLTVKVARHLGFDPRKLIASGTLLAALSPEDVPTALAQLAEAGIAATAVGCLKEGLSELSSHEELWGLLERERRTS